MNVEIRYRGKTYIEKEIDEIREVIARYRDRSRLFISKEICRRWNWRQPNGVLKDMICRGLLLQLEAHLERTQVRKGIGGCLHAGTDRQTAS